MKILMIPSNGCHDRQPDTLPHYFLHFSLNDFKSHQHSNRTVLYLYIYVYIYIYKCIYMYTHLYTSVIYTYICIYHSREYAQSLPRAMSQCLDSSSSFSQPTISKIVLPLFISHYFILSPSFYNNCYIFYIIFATKHSSIHTNIYTCIKYIIHIKLNTKKFNKTSHTKFDN